MTNRLFNEDIHGMQNINDYKALLQSIDQQYPGSGLPEAKEGLAQKLMGGGFSDKVSQPDYEQREEPVSVFADHVMQGTEKERFKANIMFKLDATKKDVQKTIDKIMLAKFN